MGAIGLPFIGTAAAVVSVLVSDLLGRQATGGPTLVPVLVVAAIMGDQVGYLIGRRAGPRLFNRSYSRLFSRHHAQRAHDFFAAHGPKAVILARFVPIVRTFTPTIAGVSAMPYRRFLTYNAIGATLWAVGMLAAGHALGAYRS